MPTLVVGFLAWGLRVASPPVALGAVSASQAAGQALFHEKGCEHCHGADGVGGETGPSLASVGRTLKPAQIEKQILDGGGAMPAFANALAPDEVSALVTFLETKRQKVRKVRGAPVKSAPPVKPDSGGSNDQ